MIGRAGALTGTFAPDHVYRLPISSMGNVPPIGWFQGEK